MGSTAAIPAATTPGRTDPPVNDPAFKRLFGHPEVAELLIRDILPEDADRIDLSTLEKLGTELVGEALARRYADLMWTAGTRDGTAQVVILIEFQGRQDRLMPLRTTIYALMAVQELLRRTRPPPHPDPIEVLQRDPERGGSTPGINLAETMNRLDRDNAVKATLAELRRLVRVAEETGDRMDWLLADCMARRKFGAAAGQRLADLLGTPPDSGRLATAAAAVMECGTVQELLRRVGAGTPEDA